MRRKRSPFAIPVMLGVTALLALLIYGVAQKQGGDEFDKAVASGKREPAPVRTVRKLGSDDTTSLAEYRGKVVLLNFWASWCGPCKDESPAMERAYQRYKSRGFVVLGAGVDDLTKDAQAFVKRYGLTYPIVKYGSANATKDFGTRYMPESFVIDREGRVVALRRGQVDDKWLDDNIAPVVAEK
ncbi:MAG: TlpA family protein disulfide reductase [Actinobacteria bacterium]|nr:TlpA family protein disulfide reductase [Actinomycetota bacterium]